MKYFVFNIDWSTKYETFLRWLQANRIEHTACVMRQSTAGQFAIVEVLAESVYSMDALAKTKNKTMLGGRYLRIQKEGADVSKGKKAK